MKEIVVKFLASGKELDGYDWARGRLFTECYYVSTLE